MLYRGWRHNCIVRHSTPPRCGQKLQAEPRATWRARLSQAACTDHTASRYLLVSLRAVARAAPRAVRSQSSPLAAPECFRNIRRSGSAAFPSARRSREYSSTLFRPPDAVLSTRVPSSVRPTQSRVLEYPLPSARRSPEYSSTLFRPPDAADGCARRVTAALDSTCSVYCTESKFGASPSRKCDRSEILSRCLRIWQDALPRCARMLSTARRSVFLVIYMHHRSTGMCDGLGCSAKPRHAGMPFDRFGRFKLYRAPTVTATELSRWFRTYSARSSSCNPPCTEQCDIGPSHPTRANPYSTAVVGVTVSRRRGE
jgi:hypothetical protein